MTPGEARVATVPWQAIAGLAPSLGDALAAVLVEANVTPADRALERVLKAHRDWSPEQRAVAAESLFGVALWRRRLRARHAHPVAPLHLLATLLIDLGQRAPAEVCQWLQLTDYSPPDTTAPPTNWRDRFSVPDWLADDLEREFGPAEAAEFAAALNMPGPVTLRANRLRVSHRDELQRALAAEAVTTVPGRHARDALTITSVRPNIYGLGAARDALFEVQDEGSQLLSELVDARPGDQVLDLCAGAGGKSLHLAAHVAPTGRVHAYDVDAGRLERLRHRAERARAAQYIAIHPSLASLPSHFERILIDAPCSELGSLRRGPDVRFRLDPADFAQHVATGRQLLDFAASRLKPKGRLVFATCTLRREENEDQVAAALKRHPSLSLVTPPLAEFATKDGYFQATPHRHGTDGFFAAILEAR